MSQAIRPVNIALVGEYSPQSGPHQQTDAAISHSAEQLGIDVVSEWIPTDQISEKMSERYSAFWIAPGSPYRNMAATLDVIRFCREEGVPCFGTCGGFQHMVLEFARNGLGISDARHAEYDPYASRLIVSRLDCSLVGRELEIALAPGSKTAEIYGKQKVVERYYCNFGVNPEYVERLSVGPFRPVGSDKEGEIRIMEIPEHPFFIGTLFVPQALSTPQKPHPLVTAFLASARDAKTSRQIPSP